MRWERGGQGLGWDSFHLCLGFSLHVLHAPPLSTPCWEVPAPSHILPCPAACPQFEYPAPFTTCVQELACGSWVLPAAEGPWLLGQRVPALATAAAGAEAKGAATAAAGAAVQQPVAVAAAEGAAGEAGAAVAAEGAAAQ